MLDHDAALSLYVRLGARGLIVRLDGERVIISPASYLTPDLRAAIRTHRDALADLLRGDIWRYRRAWYGHLARERAPPTDGATFRDCANHHPPKGHRP